MIDWYEILEAGISVAILLLIMVILASFLVGEGPFVIFK